MGVRAAQPMIQRGESALCRSCVSVVATESNRCPACGSRRITRHPELFQLTVAHLDCDAFYAAVEKRDDPSLRDRPVIVGGGKRGVVATCCYLARTYGVRSAMPMFQALKACPDAVVVKPNMAKYAAASRDVRTRMEAVTPLVEPLSIDEAFMDMSGTEKVHGMPPAAALARLQRQIERDVGVTVSIGLSHNKFLAKVASDLDKPDGFSVIGRAETIEFLATKPVSLIWGVGETTAEKLKADGLITIGQLQNLDEATLAKRYGELGLRLARISRGEDHRRVRTDREAKSVSSETTFNEDVRDLSVLEDRLWEQCERVSAAMKRKKFEGRVVTLKLKSADFRTVTRRTTLDEPSALARTAFAAARPLLGDAAPGGSWRLIGVGYSDLVPSKGAPQPELFASPNARLEAQERAIDLVRSKFGDGAIAAGRSLRAADRRKR
jgi:DNA polymerase-4